MAEAVSPPTRATFPGDLPLWAKVYLSILPIGLPLVGLVEGSDFFLLAGIAGMFFSALRQGVWCFRLTDGLFLAFAGVACLGTDIGSYPGAFFFNLGAITFLFLGSRALAQTVSGGKDLSRLMWWGSRLFFPIVAGYAALFALHAFGFQEWTFGSFVGKLTFPFRFSNQLGGYLLGALPLAIGCGRKSLPARFFLYLGFLIVIAGVGSRSAMLIAILEFIVLEAICVGDDPLPPAIRVAGLGCLIAWMGYALSGEWTFMRAIGAIDSLPFTSDPPRIEQIRRAVEFLPFWLQGIGLGCFFGGHTLEIHITPISLLTETGIGGLSLVGTWTALTILPAVQVALGKERGPRREVSFLLVAIGALLLYSLFHNLLRTRFLWMLFGLASGLHAHFRSA
ncbi:hypothetical protein AUK22_05525 [bacterium CG2_30_54_10]|nr:MAG: hypothetical protein AUK22_05525 [bacterium CG2_30_54_10]